MLRVQADRLRSNLETLGRIGADPVGGGVNRFTYSKEYYESVELLRKLMEDAGLEVKVDPVGNVIGTRKGRTDRMLILGSHIDSVPHAGIFDGCLGVMSAIEALTVINENGVELEHTVKVAAWAEEEGNVVVGLLGSGAYVGKMDDLTDIAVQRMENFHITRQDVQDARCDDLDQIDASLELHIEQGGVLDRDHVDIGVVSGIVGIERYLVTIYGTKNHAGTTPMSLRDDAMVKAAHLIVELDELARKTDPDMVYTSGWLKAEPGVANVIPGKVTLAVEARAMDLNSVHRIRDYILSRFPEGECTLQTTFQQIPVPMAEVCRNAVSEAAQELGLSQINIPSGAGHDTMILAEAIPNCGMIFVPSVGGVSHCPEEWTEWKDAANGADVLLGALLKLDCMDFSQI